MARYDNDSQKSFTDEDTDKDQDDFPKPRINDYQKVKKTQQENTQKNAMQSRIQEEEDEFAK